LRDALAGELDASTRAKLEACETCRVELAELNALALALDHERDRVADVVRRARNERTAPGEDRIAATIARVAGARGAKPDERTVAPDFPWRTVLAAAALVVVSVVSLYAFLARGHDPRPTPIQWLGGSIACSEPVGEHAAYSTFRWTYDRLPADGWYVVTVRSEEGGEIARSKRVRETTWTPDAVDTASWPNRIRWDVRAFDGSGAEIDSGYALAAR
jgi:hypothetical protein